MIRYWRMHRDPWLPADVLRRRQWARLQSILRHAFETSPFYRRRFGEAGITPDDVTSFADLRRLPVTTREDLRDPDEILSSSYERSTLKRSRTSGSTGRVTTTYFDRRAWWTAKISLKIRARLACGVRPWDRVALFQESDGVDGALRSWILRRKSFPIFDPLSSVVDEVRAYSPTALYGFPSYLARLGAVATGVVRPRVIFTSGEMLDNETRRKIETAFRAPVLDVYGSTELKEIAWECPAREGYHINSDWILVEVLDDRPGSGRRDGPLLVTSLYNYGMPLIRYQLGDTGYLIETPCSCGRGLPLMAPCLGRSVDYFVLPGGATVSPYRMTCAVENVNGLRQYQIIQEAIDRVVVKVVPVDGPAPVVEGQIREVLGPLLEGVQTSVRFVEKIEPEPSGKHRIVISRVASSGG